MFQTRFKAASSGPMNGSRMHRFWLGVGWLVLALVLWGTLTPDPPAFISPPAPQFDKFEHFGAFLFLNAWFIAARPGRHGWWLITLVFILLGGLIEIMQGWSGFRDGDWYDWYADTIGVLLGAAWPSLWLGRVHRRMTQRGTMAPI